MRTTAVLRKNNYGGAIDIAFFLLRTVGGGGALADPGFGQGGGARKLRPKFCRRSGAELCEHSEPQLAGVQGPP